MAEEYKGGGYGKRPVWQYILIYLLVGGVIYALVYYFVLARGSYSTPTPPGTDQSVPRY